MTDGLKEALKDARMEYLCGRCIHIDACLVPKNTGYVEECKFYKETPSHLPKQTNFSRITQSEEVLAEFLADKCNEAVDWILHEIDEHAGNIDQDDYWYRADVLVEWLKQESDNE